MKTLYFEKIGQGPPLLFLHGLFGSGQNWKNIAKAFQDHYSCYLVDARNHGASFQNAQHDYPSLAQDILNLIEQEALNEVVLMGHSMGGKTVLEVSKNVPESIKALAVFDILPIRYENNHQQILECMISLPLAQLKSRTEIAKYLESKLNSSMLAQFLAKSFERSADQWHCKTQFPILKDQIDHICEAIQLSSCEAPCLAIFGEDSEYYQRDQLQSFQQAFPRLEMAVIPQAGHWLHAQKPVEFISILNQFLESL